MTSDNAGQWIEKKMETRIVNGEPMEMHRTVEDAVGWFATFTEAYFEVMDMNAADYVAAEESMPEGITVLGILDVIRDGLEIMWIANGGDSYDESRVVWEDDDDDEEEWSYDLGRFGDDESYQETGSFFPSHRNNLN